MRQIIGDLVLGFGLLTRLPLPRFDLDPRRSAAAAWSWPLVGAVIGGIGAGTGALAMAAGLPAPVAAALTLIAMAMATGGLHEDGLADTADGLWGGRDAAHRLEIMRDSRVGAYGMLALGLTLLLRFAPLSALLEAGQALLLIAAAALARGCMVAMMAVLPNARADGLSHQTGRPGPVPVACALGLSILAAILIGLPLICWLAAGLTLGWLAWQAMRKIGGQTGDILGAGCLLAETAILATATHLGQGAIL